MSDLVERLRGHDPLYDQRLAALLKEAADRIEWLEGRAGAISGDMNALENALSEAERRSGRLWRILNGGVDDALKAGGWKSDGEHVSGLSPSNASAVMAGLEEPKYG